MADLSNGRNARARWVIGTLLALGLTVVVPIHLSRPFLPSFGNPPAGLHATHHTILDQTAGRLEARLDRIGHAAPHGDNVAARILEPPTPVTAPCATAAPPRLPMPRRRRLAPRNPDEADSFGHVISLSA